MAEEISCPDDFLAALNAGWTVEWADAVWTTGNGKYLIRMRHDKQRFMHTPVSIEAPHWLMAIVREQRAQERHKIQKGIREYLGL